MAKLRQERTIDRYLGISTARKEIVPKVGATGFLRRYARDYEPSPPEIVEEALTEVRLDDTELSFVDLGSGKGRVLCYMAGRAFKRVVGVELFQALHDVAVENISNLSSDWVKAGQVQSVLSDVRTYSYPKGPLILYMFNPFGAPILASVLETLEATMPRVLYIIYYEPVYAALLDRQSWLTKRAESGHWMVWASEEAP